MHALGQEADDHNPRVLWITERYPPRHGGMAVSAARQVDGLRRSGFTVTVVAFTEPETQGEVRAVPRDGGTDYHLRRARRPGFAAQTAFRVVSRDHVRHPFAFAVGFGAGLPGYLATTFAAWLGCSSLVLVRGNDFDQDWFEPYRSFFVREALSRATFIGAISPDMTRRIGALYPMQVIRFVPNGVDVAALELLPRDRKLQAEIRSQLNLGGRRVVGLFGELKPKKGIPFWLGALRDGGLMDRVALLIVGKWIDEELVQILEDPHLAPPSMHLPFSDRDKLPGLYTACDFVALPSLFDGMPNVLLESMALGVVPIVSDAGAMGEVVVHGETGFVFPAEDRRGAARSTAQALELDDLQRTVVANRARDFVVSNFSVEREIQALREIFLSKPKGKGA